MHSPLLRNRKNTTESQPADQSCKSKVFFKNLPQEYLFDRRTDLLYLLPDLSNNLVNPLYFLQTYPRRFL